MESISYASTKTSPPATAVQILEQLRQHPEAYDLYCRLGKAYQQDFLNFCLGKTGLYLCYDRFFHAVFDPTLHRDRIEALLGVLLNQSIQIVEVLPREGSLMSERGAEVIVDLLVRLQDESLVNLEIQKYGYQFPAMRMDCYCADLIMREYNRLHNLHKKKFSYRMMHPVLSLVLLENSPSEFRHAADYIHRGRMTWDSGITLQNLPRQIYVCLDKFSEVMQNKDIQTPLEAWLSVLTTQNLTQIDVLIQKFPEFAALYQDVFAFRTKPEELIYMYSEALLAADRNLDRMMIDELQEAIAKKKRLIENMNQTIADMDQTIADMDQTIADKDQTIADLQEELRRLKQSL